jgi:hypothetical protein
MTGCEEITAADTLHTINMAWQQDVHPGISADIRGPE